MPSGAPLDLSGEYEDPDYAASERIFGAIVRVVEDESSEKLGVERLEHMGAFTLAQVNVRAYHEDAFLREYEDKMSEKGFREYWEGMKADGFINPDLPSPYDLEEKGDGLWTCSQKVGTVMQMRRLLNEQRKQRQ
ncbi:hypothetical protein COL922a_012838 [Colletotrichum nupharicola]|nr:hypothetical protein COL922a_012838 [Colletotrichum nupharicola]